MACAQSGYCSIAYEIDEKQAHHSASFLLSSLRKSGIAPDESPEIESDESEASGSDDQLQKRASKIKASLFPGTGSDEDDEGDDNFASADEESY